MANEKSKAAKEIKAFAAMFSNLLSVVPDLEKLGDVEKEITDLQDRLMSLGARREALTQELEKALAATAQAREEASSMLSAAKAEAANIIESANESAAKKIKGVKDDIDLMRKQGQDELTSLNSQIEERALALKDAQIEVSKEQEKLIKFQRMVSDLRSKVGAIA